MERKEQNPLVQSSESGPCQSSDPIALEKNQITRIDEISWALAILYSFFVGLSLPQAFQVPLITIPLFWACYLLAKRKGLERPKTALCLTLVGTVNSLVFVIVSNHRILALHWLVSAFILSMLLLATYSSGRFPNSPREYASALVRYLLTFITSIPSNFHLILKPGGKVLEHSEESKSAFRHRLISLIITIFLLFIFNSLLCQVNERYCAFITTIEQLLIDFIHYLYEIGLLTMLVEVIITAPIIRAALTSRAKGNPFIVGGKIIPFYFLYASLVSLVVLFAIFCSFQIMLVFDTPDPERYRELALYVQEGFWELLFIAALGAAFWEVCQHSYSRSAPSCKTILVFLLIFTVQLLVMSFFSQHKLIIQQIFFGFRDQRILASAGVMLISLTFLMLSLKLINVVNSSTIFAVQYWCLFVVVLMLGFGNVDLFITRYNPIRFNHQGGQYKDYAYLLTNSYDNSQEWLTLMDEAEESGIPVPRDYYWGSYSSLCEGPFRDGRKLNRIDELRWKLFSHYGKRWLMRDYFKFNLRKYQAFKVYHHNQARIHSFIKFVDEECKRS